MKLPTVAVSIIVALSGALLTACASEPSQRLGRCDTTQSVGSCAVTVDTQGPRLVVCPVASSVQAPACMSTTLDVQRAGRSAQKMTVMLEPGQCVPLSTEITSAAAAYCQAYAPRTRAAEQPVQSAESSARSQ